MVTLMEMLKQLGTKLKKRVNATIAQLLQQWFYLGVRNEIFILQLYKCGVDIVTLGKGFFVRIRLFRTTK